MKAYWEWENEALSRLGFIGTEASADRERAVAVVIELLKELERLKERNK